jgi:hypothetical protein
MTIENTDLERRVLAHEQILQALMAQLAQSQPNFLDQLQGRFGAVRRGAYEHDYVETADYAEAFLREVARLVRVGVTRPAALDVAAGGACAEPVQNRAVLDESVIIHSARTRGVWHVTRNGTFVGDYLSEPAARQAAESVARDVERSGARAEILFGPNT